jgi:hypothetical protein
MMNEFTSLERLKPNLPKFVIDGLFSPAQEQSQDNASVKSTKQTVSEKTPRAKEPRCKRAQATPALACDRSDDATPTRKGNAGACKKILCASKSVKPKRPSTMARTTISVNRKPRPAAKSFDLVGANQPSECVSRSNTDDDDDGSDSDSDAQERMPAIAREACAASATAKCIPEDDYAYHFFYEGVEVKKSLQGNGTSDSGDGVFTTREFEPFEAFPIIGASISESECAALRESALDTHLLSTSAGVIDGHPRRSAHNRVGNRGASIVSKFNSPTSSKPNVVQMGMWAVVARKVRSGEELLMAYPKGAHEKYRVSRYSKTPQYYPALGACCDSDAEDAC